MASAGKHNFGAGPSILPGEVLELAGNAVKHWHAAGLSVLEISHRSAEFGAVVRKTESLVRELLGVPDDYCVLFLQGGASLQFAMIAFNFLPGNKCAAYLDTGHFSQKAISEASTIGEVEVIASSNDKNYTYIPSDFEVPESAAYFHFTSNNTIEGTQMSAFPRSPVPIICDMSSDIFSRKINIADFDLIYAGAQKNTGPAGLTVVIAKNSFIDSVRHTVPAILDYRIHRDNGSMYNTPPVFAIYCAMLNLQWLKDKGGIDTIYKENLVKAQLLYEEIDTNPLFYGLAERGDRSIMNLTFRMHDPAIEAAFQQYVIKEGIIGINGYRTVGGFRASLYNALPIGSVRTLTKCMRGCLNGIRELEQI